MVEVNPQFVRQGLLARGLPPHIADGFVMNIADESGFNAGINEVRPTVPGSRGGFGLYQLTGPRRVAFEEFAAQRGVPASDPDAQLDFLMTELQGPESRAAQSIFSAQDAPSAAVAIARDFLRPAPENLQRRVARYTGGMTPEQSVVMDTRDALGYGARTGASQMEPINGQPAQQPGGLRGLLSDPDFYDRLAIGLGGLTMNPNQALMQMSADRIAGRAQTRQDTAATNRTVEYLRSQGRDDLADAVASGSLSGKDAAAIMFQEPKERGQILSAAQMREMFPGVQIEDGLYNVKADGTANKVGGGGTTINMPGEPLKVLSDGRVVVADSTVPDGFRVVTPPGSAAADETAAADEKDQMRAGLAEASSDIVITAAQRAREAADARRVGGILGPLAAMNPATANAEIVRQVGTLQSMAAAENINAMRQASPTGGALGNASDADIMLLKQKSGALDPFSPNFERDLEDYERTLLRTIHGFEAGNIIYDQTRGGSTAPTTPDTAQMSDDELLQMYGGN